MCKSKWVFVGGFLLSLLCGMQALLAAEPVAVPKATEIAMEYYRTGNVFYVVDQLLSLLIFGGLIFSGASVSMRKLAKKWSKSWLLQVILYWTFFSIVFFLIELPLSYYLDYIREHHYGLSNQDFSKWLTDTFKGSIISFVVGGFCVAVIYGVIKKSPKRWWIYTSLLTLPFILFSILVGPLWVDPLFNRFEPMKDKALEARILQLADCAGIQGSKVYEVDKSQDTNVINAYVTGFGGTKRIVLWDTTIKKMTPDELLFVMGHEMGHFVLHHIEQQILYFFALFFGLFAFLYSSHVLIRKYKKRFKIQSVADIASLPLLLFMTSIYFLATDPLSNAFSRYHEHEADRFGLEITQNNNAAARAFVKLQQQNLGNPTPGAFYVFWRASHPPLGERINFANTYMPWKEGQPLKYQAHFTGNCSQIPRK